MKQPRILSLYRDQENSKKDRTYLNNLNKISKKRKEKIYKKKNKTITKYIYREKNKKKLIKNLKNMATIPMILFNHQFFFSNF